MQCDIKMSKLASCGGCGAKVGAGMLSQILQGIPTVKDENLLVGYDTSDDAAVYRVSDDLAIVQTLDFFPPIVDDPFMFGQIAAANAISDIYAMGATPKIALNIMTVTPQMPKEMIHEVLRGGYEKAYEAGVVIAGGHTINDQEPKYGLSVTGFARPEKIQMNCTPKEGDLLILTKPLGIGIITTANRAELADAALYQRAVRQMATLNKYACEIARKYRIHSMTDVTGFALMGHATEMARGSDLTIVIDSGKVPVLPGVLPLAEMGLIPEGAYRNRQFAGPTARFAESVPLAMQDVLYDPQTSGGLLIAVEEQDARALLQELQQCDKVPGAEIIGYVEKQSDCSIYVK